MTGVPIRGWRGALLLSLLTAAAFANVFGNGWHYDDVHAITENPHVRSFSEPLRFFLDPTLFSGEASYAMYRPLLLTSLAVNHAWSGYDTWSWHLVNLAIHVGCALLLGHILRRLGRLPAVAWVGALVFALHPLATEPVNYISSRSESLAALFALGAFLAHLEFRARGRWYWQGLSVALFGLGLLSKSIAIVTIALILLHDLRADGWRRALSPARWVAYAAVAVLYLSMVSSFVSRAVVGAPVRGMGLQLATQAKAIPHYLKLVLFPVGLNVHHQFFEGGAPLLIAAAVALVASLLWLAWRAPPDVGFGVLWAGLVLTPTVVVPLFVLVNDHRLYLPLAGLVIAGSGLLRRPPGVGLVVALAAVLAVTTWQRNRVWENEHTLWSDAAAKSPHALVPVAHIHLGNYAKEAGALRAAEGHYRDALEIDADHIAARNNLGIVLQRLGRLDEAAQLYGQLTADEPEIAEAWYNLGRTYQLRAEAQARTASATDAAQGNAVLADYARARAAYHRVAADSRHHHLALNNLGAAFQEAGLPDSAACYYRRAIDAAGAVAVQAGTAGGYGDAVANVARLLAGVPALASQLQQLGAYPAIETLCRELLAAAPHVGDDAVRRTGVRDARFWLAVSLLYQGDVAASIEQNRRLVDAYPGFAEGYLQLANAHETAGDPASAAATYRAQLRAVPVGELSEIARQRLQRLEGGGR